MSIRIDANEYISVSSNFPQATALTVAMFVTRKVDTGTYGCLNAVTNTVAGTYIGPYLVSNGDDLQILTDTSGTTTVITFANDSPSFVAWTSSGVGGSNGYLQARALTSAALTKSAAFPVAATLNAVDRFRVGSDGFGSFFNGQLESLIVWDRVLTDAELLRQSKQRKPIDRKNLRMWLPMMDDSTVANNYVDYSGNGYNYTATGSPSAEAGTSRISWRGGNCRT